MAAVSTAAYQKALQQLMDKLVADKKKDEMEPFAYGDNIADLAIPDGTEVWVKAKVVGTHDDGTLKLDIETDVMTNARVYMDRGDRKHVEFLAYRDMIHLDAQLGCNHSVTVTDHNGLHLWSACRNCGLNVLAEYDMKALPIPDYVEPKQ